MNYGERSIIKEIQKRPFIRPLIFWITGTILQVCFPLQRISITLFISAVVFVVISSIVSKRYGNLSSDYQNRWVWGVIFAALLIFLSIQRMSLAEQQAGRAAKPGLFLEKAVAFQERMVNKLDLLRLSDEKKAVLATITVNYRKNMPRDVSRRFSIVGLSHLLSVSGFHVGIISLFICLMLSYLPVRIVFFRCLKYTLTIFFIWIYTYTTGLATAAVRAAIMISIYLVGQMLNRKQDTYNTLAAAAFCMLVYNPLYLFDIGFQLSYTAVFFIIYLQPRLEGLLEVKNPLLASPWKTMTVTISAQTGTIFLCFYYFGQSSIVSLFTNLLLSLLSMILIPGTLLWMLVPPSMSGTESLRSAIEFMTNSMMWVVDRFAAIPGAAVSVRFDFFTLVFSYICLALIMLYAYTRKYWMLFSALSTLIIILCRHLYKSLMI